MNFRCILAVFLVLAAVSASARPSYLVDWNEVGRESIDHLVNLIRIDTSNPPGNETEAVRYLQTVLAADGIDSQVYALERACQRSWRTWRRRTHIGGRSCRSGTVSGVALIVDVVVRTIVSGLMSLAFS